MRASSIWQSFRFAFAGLFYILRTQRNARIHLAVTTVVTALGAWLGLDLLSWAVLVLAIGLVLTVEILNTVAETIVDLASPELHPLARIAKDAAAAGVLVAAMAAVIVGLLILGPPILRIAFPT